MPIGSDAKYVHACLEPGMGMTIDEDYIVMKPDAPLVSVYRNNAGWDRQKSRCTKDGELLFSVPIPES